MSNLGNKDVFANNLKKYMQLNGKSRTEVCQALGFKYSTFADWINGKKYPRMDKIEMLANYFGIMKSDLIEDKAVSEETSKKIDAATDVLIRMETDKLYCELVMLLYKKNKTIDYIFANMKGRPPTNSQFLTQMYYHIQRCRN